MWSSYIVPVLVGAIAGWLGSKVVSGESNGLFVNLFIGIIGSVLGKFVFSTLHISAFSGFGSVMENIIVATIGSILLLLALKVFGSFFKKKRSR